MVFNYPASRNLVDAANIAALAALSTFRRPECSLSGDDGQEVIVHPPEVRFSKFCCNNLKCILFKGCDIIYLHVLYTNIAIPHLSSFMYFKHQTFCFDIHILILGL